MLLAILTMQYALAKLELPDAVRTKFTDYLADSPENKGRLKDFFWTLIPPQRFQYDQYNGKSILIPFTKVPGRNISGFCGRLNSCTTILSRYHSTSTESQ